ncbi:MAG: CRISPR-associated endonuclease Cas1 [Cyanobacteria bacterium SID2]|nr:CRISPR-associated endonuclease Cas1 [Cyanobacteria bacterium SID2]MBP0003118.1 CRISPR-associated endonuclease Cas1 [Cyanobacteria bacterium SBC]
MTTLYLTRSKTHLTVDRSGFAIQYCHRTTSRYPISQVKQIVCFEGVRLNRTSQREIQRHQIPLLQLDRTGTICGRWYPKSETIDRHLSPSTVDRLDLAEWLLKRHLEDSIDLLTRLQGTPTLQATGRVLLLLHETLSDADSLDMIRGYYATGTAYFDRALRETLSAYILHLNGSRPPMTVSQLLRVGESLLHHHLEIALTQARFDLSLGSLHVPADCDAPLVCDGVAVLRPCFVDAFVVRWLHHCCSTSITWLAFCTAWERQPFLHGQIGEFVESLRRWLTA